MQWRRSFVTFGIALLIAALATPVAAMCGNGCPCPVAKMDGTASAPCAAGSTVGPMLTCCAGPPAAETSPALGAIASLQREAPAPLEHPLATAPVSAIVTFATIAPSGRAPAVNERARAERRHDRGLCVLNSVFLN